MIEHTKEPWATCGCGHCALVWGNNGKTLIAEGADQSESDVSADLDEQVANARRIVACVNACKGMKDPEADIAALRAEVATPVLVATNRLADSLADARAQRDELLAALKHANKLIALMGLGDCGDVDYIKQAIAHSEGRHA